MFEVKDQAFIQALSDVSQKISGGEELIGSDLVLDLQTKARVCAQEIEDIKREDRVLKIGIVGEVKAGKSSFLNALIFDGENFLPKAPTPMTAALTKLGYCKKPYAKILFYTAADWDRIEHLSAEFDKKIDGYYTEAKSKVQQSRESGVPMDMPTRNSIEMQYKNLLGPELVSCKELTRMVDERMLNLDECLGQVKTLHGDVLSELSNYVGANGEWTPVVKHTEVFINNPLLEGIEIVDTPGLNDPILSRSETTKQFLVQCDVVFLLSYVGQFLTSSDIQFLTKTLPLEGIKRAVLVGSKLDSGILDYRSRTSCTFLDAYKDSIRNYNNQAQINIQKCMSDSYCPPVIFKLNESLPPKYISSLMYQAGMSVKKSVPYSSEVENVVANIRKRFEGFDESEKGLFGLAGIDKIKNGVLQEVIRDKEIILQDRIATFTQSQISKFLLILESINISARQNLSSIKQYDQLELQQKLEMLTEKLDSIRAEVKYLFEGSAVEAKKYMKNVEKIIDGEVNNFIDFQIRQCSHEKHRTISTGLFGWKKEHYTDTETIQTADISEVLANLRRYADKCNSVANDEFNRLFRIEELKRRVKEIVQGAFDLTDRNFNENDVLIPLENALKRLTIPTIRIDSTDYKDEIINSFSEEVVEGIEIAHLRVAQEKAISRMRDDAINAMEKSGDEIETSLQRQASEFVDGIVKQISVNISIIKSLLEDKENAIAKFKTFIDVVLECKEIVLKLE